MTGKKNAYNTQDNQRKVKSMATGKALDGKPYAGNPHVRFDEGEVAPAAKPRRGSLLYKPFARNNLSAATAWMGAFPDEVRVTGVVTLSDWEAGRDADAESLLDDFRLMAENIMAFGDSTNDEQMLLHAGIGVAVGNAVPELLDIADYIAPTHDDDGVAYTLEHLLGI